MLFHHVATKPHPNNTHVNNTHHQMTPPKKNDNIELRSEKVRTLLGEIPSSLIRWGTVVIVAIFLVLLLVLCFMPYPHSNGESIITHILCN